MPPGEFWKQTPRTLDNVMRGRRKGIRDQTIALAHQVEAMAREKRLKPLKDYLETGTRKPAGNAAVIAMFDELAKQGVVKVRRIQRNVAQ